jgi:hypothetical protein
MNGFGVRAAEAEKIMQCHTQNLGDACLLGVYCFLGPQSRP